MRKGQQPRCGFTPVAAHPPRRRIGVAFVPGLLALLVQVGIALLKVLVKLGLVLQERGIVGSLGAVVQRVASANRIPIQLLVLGDLRFQGFSLNEQRD